MDRRDFLRTSLLTYGSLALPGNLSARRTLDIGERARLGVHVLTSITDPEVDDEIYWSCHFFRNPPAMEHDFNDWVQNQEGLMEALPLLRLASGDNLNS